MSPRSHLNLLRSSKSLLVKTIGIEPTSLDTALDQSFVQVEGYREPFTPRTALVPRSIIEQYVGRGIETRPGYVLDTVSEDVNK